MHKRLWNLLKLEFELQPKAPLLIKSGMLSPNPSLPDMQFVRTRTANGESVFIPGSSLKGVFRGFTEKVLRTANDNWACDPFGDGSCGRMMIDVDDTARVYRQSCRACKIYGNTRLRGRLSFTDALPNGGVVTETRYGVAISRLTNAVAAGPFDIETLVQGTFKGSVVLENFEVWQLGLLALTLQALNDGLVKIGFGKNRGFGEVEIRPSRIVVDMAKHSHIPAQEIWGVGMFVNDAERTSYGLSAGDKLDNLPEGTSSDLGVYIRREYKAEEWQTIAERAVQSLSTMGA
ncbi:MAG: RAMP superfamily CRISPR-associated protein [Blastocatellia bacterium]|nr:RAMP superfamily CRISPR-associated protein [Blastocatellia bacterium]MDW8166907.1 RAMP superfamily CRISPR-associated protein [Acidobacteriota bacterium]